MTDKIKELENNLKVLKAENVEDNVNEKIKENMQMSIYNKLNEFSRKFKLNQEAYMSKYRDLVGEDSINTSISFNKTTQDLNKDNFLMTDSENNVLKKRDEALTKMLDLITSLSQMYQDMQNLVMEQGSILDRIDYNIELAAAHVEKGKENVKKAESYQKKNCYRNVIMILIVTIFVESLMIVLKFI